MSLLFYKSNKPEDARYKMKIGNLEVKIIRKNIKNLYLRVAPTDGEVRVTCPQKLDEQIIQEFVNHKRNWIERQRAKIKAQPAKPPRQYVTGESCYFKGDRYILNVIDYHGSPKVILEPNQGNAKLNLYIRYGSIKEQREQALTNWYRQQLKAELPSLIDKWSSIIGVQLNDWRVKKMKTRWGTCNPQAKRIWLNLELIKKPQKCLEYVIVHELVHLLERQHNKRFRGYVNQFMPEWEQYQTELNDSTLI